MILTYSISANDLGTAAALASQRAFADRFTHTNIVGLEQTGRSEFQISVNAQCDNCASDEIGLHHRKPPTPRAGSLEAAAEDPADEDSAWARGAAWGGEKVAAHRIPRGHGTEHSDGLSRSQFGG